MKIKYSLFLLFVLLLGSQIPAQDIADETVSSDREELQKQAVKYLRETVSEINNLRTNENRISFSSELANLMWYHDEKEARRMFSGVADNFVQLLTEYNSRVDSLGGMRDEGDVYGGFRLSRDQRRDAIRKVYKARDVREQVALAIAEHDAQLAYDFVIRTTATVTDKMLAERFTEQNERLEKRIIDKMAARNMERSLAFGRRSLRRGFSTELVGLAVKIYRRDPEAAIEFGEELVEKVRSEAKPEYKSFSDIHFILHTGRDLSAKAKEGVEPLFDKETLKGLADLLARNLLQIKEFDSYRLDQYVEEIEQHSPSQARRLQAKLASMQEGDKSLMGSAAVAVDVAKIDGDKPDFPSAEQAAEQARTKERTELMKELWEFGKKELTSEQKSKFISRARRIVADTSEPTLKIAMLSSLAVQVKKLGDDDLASEIMREGNSLVSPDPRNFMDYMLTWTLIAGYAQVEPDEAFAVVENAIYRLNDTIGAFVKVAEFIDVQGDLVIDGEVQLGAFGGSMTRNIVGAVQNSGNVVKALAEADFERTKALAESFEQPEVRILARFLVLRSVLEKRGKVEMDKVRISR